MSTYIFFGTIRPEHAVPSNLSFSIPPLQFGAKDLAVSFEVTASICGSQIAIEVKNVDGNIDLLDLRNCVREDVAMPTVDALNYLWGQGYDVDISSVVELGGRHIVFGVGIPELWEAQAERPLPLDELWKLVFRPSQHLRLALGNLREAVRMANDTGFFCYRAVESIRQSFKKEEDGKDKKQSWKRLKEELLIDESWIKVLTPFSDEQRHGGIVPMSGEDRVSAMQHAWKVVDRFCIYLHRGSMPLSKNEFDLLRES